MRHKFFNLEDMGITPELQKKYFQSEELLTKLTTKPAYQFDKQRIEQLCKLNLEEIDHFDQEQANTHLESLNNLKEVSMKIWNLFKLTSPDPHDDRVLQIIGNHTNGKAVQRLQELKADCERVGLTGIVDDSKLPIMEKASRWADIYMEVHQHKIQLENNTALVCQRVEVLLAENYSFSTCAQQ